MRCAPEIAGTLSANGNQATETRWHVLIYGCPRRLTPLRMADAATAFKTHAYSDEQGAGTFRCRDVRPESVFTCRREQDTAMQLWH